MQSIDVNAFLSCSFNAEDKALNEFIRAICTGLDIKLANVSTGASALPLDKARALIENSDGLIAICTPREELTTGAFNMPQAVNDEIAFAYGIGRPILAFVEVGVNKGGFREKFRTYHEFDRAKLTEAAEIEKIVRAIHEFKVEVIGEGEAAYALDRSDSYADELSHLIELKCSGSEFFWEYTTNKRIVFKRNSAKAFPTSVFSASTVRVPEGAAPIEWEFEQLDSTRSIKLVQTIDEQTPTCVEARLRPEPAAHQGDQISYRTFSRSRYLIPLWEDEIDDEKRIYLEKGEFRVFEGLLFLHRTKKAKIEFRIAREYGLKARDLVPFVASYTSSVDFEVPAELERITISSDDFGGALTVRMEIESALPGHLYGVAWNPLKRPVPTGS